nr:transposase [Methylomicrobium lacus]
MDEAGFAPQPPNRSAWTKKGETHAVTAKRGRRLNVIGAMRSSGKLVMAKRWQSINGVWFFAFLMAMLDKVSKPLVVILDNASIHTAKKLKPYWDLLEEKDQTGFEQASIAPDHRAVGWLAMLPSLSR